MTLRKVDRTRLGTHEHAATDLTSGLVDDARLNDATISDIRTSAVGKVVTPKVVWDAAAGVDLGNLTGNVTLDFSTFLGDAFGALTGNVTFNAIANAKVGQGGVFELTHSGAARTISINTTLFAIGDGVTSLALSKVSGAVDLVGFRLLHSGKCLVYVAARGV